LRRKLASHLSVSLISISLLLWLLPSPSDGGEFRRCVALRHGAMRYVAQHGGATRRVARRSDAPRGEALLTPVSRQSGDLKKCHCAAAAFWHFAALTFNFGLDLVAKRLERIFADRIYHNTADIEHKTFVRR